MANPYRVGIELAMLSNHAQVLGALSRSLFQFLNELWICAAIRIADTTVQDNEAAN